jgi:diguanylate cyclase (GGDEF)-like protein
MTEPANITFGILTDYVADYHRQIIRGIQATLERAGISSVVFVGTDLTGENLPAAGEPFAGSNAAYDLISPRMGGLIALSGSMGPTLNDDQLLGFFARFAPLPLVSVGRVLPGIPSLVSHPTGMRDLMRHLIEDCGHRRFAFVRGFVGETDSDARERVFREALAEHHLELHEDDVLTGEYFSVKAYEVTRQWLQRGPNAGMPNVGMPNAQVIVSASDDMAFGILQALEEAGLNVPEDIALTGFDDLETSQHCLPPLTSVRQPLFELGVQAARMILERHRGLPVEAVVDLPSTLVVRESTRAITETPTVTLLEPSEIGLEALREAFMRSVRGPNETGQAFLRVWRNWMRTDQVRGQTRLWQDVLQRLILEMPTNLEPEVTPKALALWGRAHALTLSEGQVLRQRHRLNEQTGISWYHGFDVALMSEANIPAVTRNVVRFLPDLGLDRCYIALFETYGAMVCDTAHLVLAFENGLAQPFDPMPFATRNLLPESMQQRLNGHLYLQPLFVNDEQYGWMMVEVSNQQAFYFEALHQTLSGGIHNAVQAKRLSEYTGFLEARISERTQELEASNDQLRAENAERRLTQDALRTANAQLRQATLQDGLTGVSNRAALDDYLERQLRSQRRNRQPLTFVMCDIDFFKPYNDHYGHLAGDHRLRQVAQAIKQSLLRSEDMVARYGGEEFALVLPNTDLEHAKHVIERIQKALKDLDIPHRASPTSTRLTLSMGAISLIPDDSCEMHNLIQTADLGLYEAKANGRNTVIWQTALRHDEASQPEFMLE